MIQDKLKIIIRINHRKRADTRVSCKENEKEKRSWYEARSEKQESRKLEKRAR